MPLTGLTQEQFAAATAPPSPIIIVAGPGSGKTRTIVARARYYSQVIDPRRILLVTFTNKAAREAEERLSRLGASGFYVATFHSLCALATFLRERHFSIAVRMRRSPSSRKRSRLAPWVWTLVVCATGSAAKETKDTLF
jgi:superfamily I DNA/RNA helicase